MRNCVPISSGMPYMSETARGSRQWRFYVFDMINSGEKTPELLSQLRSLMEEKAHQSSE